MSHLCGGREVHHDSVPANRKILARITVHEKKRLVWAARTTRYKWSTAQRETHTREDHAVGTVPSVAQIPPASTIGAESAHRINEVNFFFWLIADTVAGHTMKKYTYGNVCTYVHENT